MTRVPPASSSPDGRSGHQVSDGSLRRFGEAIANLSGDSEYIVSALTDMLLTMTPVSRERLPLQVVQFLIESGAFTADEWADTSASVDRDALHTGAAKWWLQNLLGTSSLKEVSGFLNWDEEAVRTAVSEGRLYAIEISGQLRFPGWQLDVGGPYKLLPGLTAIVEGITPELDWRSVAGFMATPQACLSAEGRKTPIEWLRDGGSVNDVIGIIEASHWS